MAMLADPAPEVEQPVARTWIEAGKQHVPVLDREVAVNGPKPGSPEREQATSGDRPGEQPVGNIEVDQRRQTDHDVDDRSPRMRDPALHGGHPGADAPKGAPLGVCRPIVRRHGETACRSRRSPHRRRKIAPASVAYQIAALASGMGYWIVIVSPLRLFMTS